MAFYFGGAYTARGLSGITGILGMVYQHHDLQLSYTFGLTESDAVYWGGDKNTGTKYKMQAHLQQETLYMETELRLKHYQ